MVVLSKEEYASLESAAKKRRLPSGKLVEIITKDWLERKETMLRDEGLIRQEQDHYSLAIRPQLACQNEYEGLSEWLQQELISVTSRADILERTALDPNVAERIRKIGERAKEINLRDFREVALSIENIFACIKDRRIQNILEIPSLLEREMIPLRNLVRELYCFRETLNLLQVDLSPDSNYDDC